MKIIGIIPARMQASRFPGKPLFNICGRPMLEHVYLRAQIYKKWTQLLVSTCDQEIQEFAKEKGFPYIMTGSHHDRALDRVAEAVDLLGDVDDDDIIVNVQGDEPMMRPDMIDAVIEPLIKDSYVGGTILGMHIVDESIWLNPDTVKLITNSQGEVLYTSRAPIPYCKGEFTPELKAQRIYGIFAFRWKNLKAFTNHAETRLEKLEACDSNRTLDMDFRQFVAPYPNIKSYSVDSPSDIQLVEKYMKEDDIWKIYN